MARKRKSSPDGQRKLSNPKSRNANTRHHTRNKMEVANIDDSVPKRNKPRTTTHVPEDASVSQVSDQSSVILPKKRTRKPKNKLDLPIGVVKDTKLIKGTEELVSTVPLATVGHHLHVNKLHHKRKEDSQSASSSSLAAAVTEAREGLGGKLDKAPTQTSNQPGKAINKQSTKRKVAHRILKIKGLGRKERKFINNLHSYRDQPSIVTRLKEVNVVKPKPRRRTLSGEFELLDEGLLKKQLKFDEARALKSAIKISKSSNTTLKQRKQKRSVKIGKHAERIIADKPLKKRIVGKMKHITFINKGVNTVTKIRTKRGALRKLHINEDIKNSESVKSSSSETSKITKAMIRKVKTLETQPVEQEVVNKTRRKKRVLKYADPPILFAEPHNSGSLDPLNNLEESVDQEVSFKDSNTVASSPPPILEKAVESIPSSLDAVLPIKKVRGRTRFPSKKVQLMEKSKIKLQVGTVNEAELTDESKTDDFKDTQVRKRKRPRRDDVIAFKKRKITSRTFSGIMKRKAPAKQVIVLGETSEVDVKSVNERCGVRLKTKRRTGGYDFPGKKKQKQLIDKKSALFFEVNNVRAGRRKPKKHIKDFTVKTVDNSDVETKMVDNKEIIVSEPTKTDSSLDNKEMIVTEPTKTDSSLDIKQVIVTEPTKTDSSFMEQTITSKDLIKKGTSNKSELSMTSDLISEDSMSNTTTIKVFVDQEKTKSLNADSDSDSEFDDLPLISFIKKKPLSTSIGSSDIPTIAADAGSQTSEKPTLISETISHSKTADAIKSNITHLVSSLADIASSSLQIVPPAALVSVSSDEMMNSSHHEVLSDAHIEELSVDSQTELTRSGIHEHSGSAQVFPSTSDVSCNTPQHIDQPNGEQIQLGSDHLETASKLTDDVLPSDHKLTSVELESETVVQLNTDSSDSADKSEDANNNAENVQLKPTLVVSDVNDKVSCQTETTVENPSFVTDCLPDKDPVLGNSDDSMGTVAGHDISVSDTKLNDFKGESQITSSQSLDVLAEEVDVTPQPTGGIQTAQPLNKSAEELNVCLSGEEKTNITSTSFSENPVVVTETNNICHDTDDSVFDGKSKGQEKIKSFETAKTKHEQHHQLPSHPSTEVTGLKVILTKNKGSYKISDHSQSTGSESDDKQDMTVSKHDTSHVQVDDQNVFSDSPSTSNTEQSKQSEDVPDSDNRRVPPLKIKFKSRVTKPVRHFALRPKFSRSPIEIIAMKQRKIEEEYQQHEAFRLARRLEKQILKRKLLHQAKLAAESNVPAHSQVSNISEMLAHCKPCRVKLVDFVKQLHLGKSEIENGLAQTSFASHGSGEKSKGIKLKIKNISKQPKIVGKRGRPPKLKPKHPVSESPVNQVSPQVYVERETCIAELNEEGFVGSFVEFLKKDAHVSKHSLIQKEDPCKTIENDSSKTVQEDISKPGEKDQSATVLSDTTESNMQSSTTDSHKVSKYCCKTCDFTTAVKQTIEMHVYRHIPGILFKCGYCCYDFASMASACAHAKNEHVAQESKILKSKEVTESDHYYTIEDVLPLEKDPSQTTNEQITDGSTPVVINVVVKGNVALTPPSYSVPSKRFICTHCKYSTNVKGDINQHVLDLHASDHVYICTLCSESFYVSEQEMANHCSLTHPSRPCPYRLLPPYYDIEQLKNAQKMKEDDRGNIFERMTNLFQASPSVDENQPEEVVREQHYARAREFLYIQEGWMRKTSAEADSTTRDTESLMDIPSTDLDEDQQPVSTGVTETDSLVESIKTVDVTKDLIYQEPHDETLQDDSGISELKIIDVVSLRDQENIMDESMCESFDETTEPVHQPGEQILSEPLVEKTKTVVHREIVGRTIKPRSNASSRARSSNLPEIDVDAIVQRNERLTCTYKCQKCNIHSPYLSAMVEHLKNHHTDIDLFTCPYCKGSRGKRPQFSSELNVHEHVKLVHPTNFAKNEVSLSDAAKEFVQVIAIPSGAECCKVGNTFVIEKDIYMCLRCQAHMPSLDYTFSHLEREHTEVFVYVCPHCKIFKDKNDEVVFKHISDSHHLEITDDSLPLAIEDNLFIRVPSISKSGSYSERGNRHSNQKSDKVKLALSKMESNIPKVTPEPSATLSKPLSIEAEKRKHENVGKSVPQTVVGGAGKTSSSTVVNKLKTTQGRQLNTNRVNPRKQADPSHALVLDCESVDDPVICTDDTDDICNEDVLIVSCEPGITTTPRTTAATVSNVHGSVHNSLSFNRVDSNLHSDKTGATSPAMHSSNLHNTSDRLLNAQSPGARSSNLPLNRISSLNQCAPRLKSSIYSIADRLHRLHSQNKANDKSSSSGDHSSSSSPVPVARAVLKVPSVPLRNSTPVAHSQVVTSQSLSNVASVSNKVSASVASPSVSGVQKHKSLLFSNCPLDLSGMPLTQTTVEQVATSVTSPAPQPPLNKDPEELRPESFQIFNLKPKRKTDSPQRAVPQHTVSPKAHAAAATILSNAQQVPALQPLHQAYPLAQLAQMPFQQVPIRFGIGMPNFIATGQPTLITLRQPMMGSRVVQDLVNFQRMAVSQQALAAQQQSLGIQQQSLAAQQQSLGVQQQSPGVQQQSPGVQQQSPGVPKAPAPDTLRAVEHAASGIDTRTTRPNVKNQRPASQGAPVHQPSKYVSSPNNPTVRQQLLQAEFYCPYCSEFRPLREFEVLPHIQRSHPKKEVLYLRRDKL